MTEAGPAPAAGDSAADSAAADARRACGLCVSGAAGEDELETDAILQRDDLAMDLYWHVPGEQSGRLSHLQVGSGCV